jgi:hypothetical protein
MGNRGGALHGPDRRLGARRWVSPQWICCLLEFKDRRREVMAPGRYTELFFLDEATALAAGHRPCFECRRADAVEFSELWWQSRRLATRVKAAEIDRVLHGERVDGAGRKRLHRFDIDGLPDGVMILDPQRLGPALVTGRQLRPWTFGGYAPASPRPRGVQVDALTPPSIIAVLKLGYRPKMPVSGRDPVQ